MSDIQMPQGTIADDTMVEIRGGWVVPWAVAAEIEGLRARVTELEGQHKGLVMNNAMLRQRPDLPADRIPVASAYEAEIKRLSAALEWALDHAASDHPNYPYREDDKWTFPYLVSNAGGFGGGVGNAYFSTALEAVEAALHPAPIQKEGK